MLSYVVVGVESDWAYWTKEERENGEWEVPS